jgi:hypothetical protein
MFNTLDFYHPREDAMGTEKQNAANRGNAAQSTGPTSRQGKRQSALNSLNHGIYSAKPTAIPRGYFKEDPDEIKRYVAGIVEALEPRDALEDAEANRVAVYFLRLRRLDRFEAEALAGDTASRVIHGDVSTPSQNTGNLEAHAEESAALAIEHTLERASRIDSRIARGLERALIVYYQLRKSRDSEVDTVEVLVESGTGSEGTLLGLQSSS